MKSRKSLEHTLCIPLNWKNLKKRMIIDLYDLPKLHQNEENSLNIFIISNEFKAEFCLGRSAVESLSSLKMN